MQPYSKILDYLSELELPTVRSNKKIDYINIEAGFDIETTSYKKDGVKSAFMYIWQIGIGYGGQIFYGRTWNDFMDCLEMISDYLKLNPSKRLVIYVHNLAYEFQFMRKYFNWIDVFAIDERKVIKAVSDMGIEFRDSYILSGYSLANTAKNLVKNKVDKMVGDLDYKLIRTHETPLSDKEIQYCINDIQIILAYINEEIEYNGDVTKIPMTSTGRVRKYVRNNCYYRNTDGKKAAKGQYIAYRKIMGDLTLDLATYSQLKNAFMGGFTHANAYFSNKILEKVTSIDFTSAYPSVMLSEKFPMSRFKSVKVKSVKELDVLCERYALVFEVKFDGISSKISQENYISESKCRNIVNATINNGRISSADSITCTLTETDYHIMKQCYQWESIGIYNVKYAHKAYLPKAICKSILDLYQDKTQLKDVAGSEVEYLLSKGMLNSVYGMCVTDVVKERSIYGDDDNWHGEMPDIIEEIVNYNESRNRFLYYAWGVWITAYARRNLWTGILATGNDYVYSDTDSLKVLNYEKHKPYIEWFDSQIINKMESMCDHYQFDKTLLNPKTKDGVHKMLGVWDYEGTYSRFKTLGSKRYLYQDGDKLQITVAGLSKQNGLNYMMKVCDNDPLKVFNMFNDSLHIPSNETGKNSHTYIDSPQSLIVTDYQGVKTEVHTLSGLYLEECEFTLSISDQYKQFIQQLSQGYIYKGVKHV